MPLLVVCCVALPALELWVLWQVAGLIGWPLALVALLAISATGVVALRARGVVALRRLRTALRQNRVPGGALVDQALDEAGALALAVPGFVTAAFGAVLMAPPSRAVAVRLAEWGLRRRADAGRAPQVHTPRRARGTVSAPVPATVPDGFPGDDALLDAFVGGTDETATVDEAVTVDVAVDAAAGAVDVLDPPDVPASVTAVVESAVYAELASDPVADGDAADAWATFGTDRQWESEPRRRGRRRRRGRDRTDDGGGDE